jgi:hypothetical protein
MSKVTDMAEAEARDVEAEDEDETDEPEPAPDDEELEEEAEPEARGPTDADMRKFEAENTRHEKALAKVVGDDWELFEACGVCGGVGHVPAASNVDVPFERDPQTEPCETCKGYGTTLTGAKEPGMVSRACSRCQGSGWTSVQEHPEIQPLALAPTSTPEELAGNGAPSELVDPRVAALQAEGFIVVSPITLAPAPGS